MMRRLLIALAALALGVCAQAQHYVASAYTSPNIANSLTISSPAVGDSVFIVFAGANSNMPTGVELGSTPMTESGTCAPVEYGESACLWYIANVVSPSTTISWTGYIMAQEFEFSGMNTASIVDAVGTCVATTDCAASLSPAQANEVVISAMYGANICTVETPITFTNATSSAGSYCTGSNNDAFQAGISSAIATITATGSGYGNGSVGSGTGAVWSFKGAAPTGHIQYGYPNVVQ